MQLDRDVEWDAMPASWKRRSSAVLESLDRQCFSRVARSGVESANEPIEGGPLKSA
jgi:hypothetical protein